MPPTTKPKPAVVRHANAKPDAAAKPATPAATDTSAAKPAKPKAAAKPKTAPKTSGETKPARLIGRSNSRNPL